MSKWGRRGVGGHEAVLHQADVCVVGSGPAGTAVATALARCEVDVVVVEAGGGPGRDGRRLVRAEDHDAPWHAPLESSVCQAIGGNLHLWGGRCVPLDRRDIERPLAPHAVAWPLAFDEIDRHVPAAARFLGCGTTFRCPPFPDLAASAAVDTSGLEQWTPIEETRERLRRRLVEDARIRVLSDTVVVGFVHAQDAGTAERRGLAALRVRRGDTVGLVRARHFVLAAGGVETTRLLLVEQRREPGLFGGEPGPLGRYYMGHLTGAIASVAFADAEARDALDFFEPAPGALARRRLSLRPDFAAARDIDNIVFWVENLPCENPDHGSALRSLKFLLRGGRARDRAGPALLARHLRNLLRGPLDSLRRGRRYMLTGSALDHHRLGQLFPAPSARYALTYHAEHAPEPANRITLGDERDAHGVPLVRIRFRYGERDLGSVIRAHEALKTALDPTGRLDMRWSVPPEDRAGSVLLQARDGFHQIGSTRMAASDRDGVVDADLRVHGFDNLFVASSSVFPTSGQGNPTLCVVALSLRLGAHIADRLGATIGARLERFPA